VLVKKALAEGKTAPKYHALTRPARAEAEATHRAIALAEIAGVPIYIVVILQQNGTENATTELLINAVDGSVITSEEWNQERK